MGQGTSRRFSGGEGASAGVWSCLMHLLGVSEWSGYLCHAVGWIVCSLDLSILPKTRPALFLSLKCLHTYRSTRRDPGSLYPTLRWSITSLSLKTTISPSLTLLQVRYLWMRLLDAVSAMFGMNVFLCVHPRELPYLVQALGCRITLESPHTPSWTSANGFDDK